MLAYALNACITEAFKGRASGVCATTSRVKRKTIAFMKSNHSIEQMAHRSVCVYQCSDAWHWDDASRKTYPIIRAPGHTSWNMIAVELE